MTMTSWPYVDQDTTDVEYGRLFREMAGSDGVAGSFGDTTLRVQGDSSGRQVKMSPGAAVLRGYMFYSNATETLPVATASSQPRVDRVVLELNLSAPSVAERIRPRILQGTPAASGATPPPLTQTPTGIYQIELAMIEVPANAAVISAANVYDRRYWMDQPVGQWDSARRPTNPRKYKLGFNESLGIYEYWNGADWIALGSVNLEDSRISGILPIARGGTGAGNPQAARQNLDIWVQPSQPPYAANRVWIRVP